MRSASDRIRVGQLAKQGKNYRQIVRITKFSRPFVQRWMGRDGSKSKNRGRKSTIDATQRKVIKRLLKAKRDRPSLRKVSARLAESYDIKASPQTVMRVRKTLGLKPYKGYRRPQLSDRQKERRLAFATDFANHDWTCVLFTDETTFELYGRPRNDFVYCESADQVPKRPTVKHPPKVHAWAGISHHGKTSLHLFEGIINADLYISILDEHLEEMNDIFDGDGWVFQQDNDPKHTSKRAQKWITDNVPEFITPDEWPSQSPDLNPIEHVWALLKDRVYSKQPPNIDQLKRVLMREWQNFELVLLQNLTASMTDRLNAVRAAQGDSTRY